MIRIKRYDHVSMAVPELDPQIEIMERLFGFRLANRFESDDGFFGANLAIPGRSPLYFEVLAPRGEDSYLHRFLAGPTGPGLHHMAIQIESTEQAASAIEAEGDEPWGHSPRQPDDERGTIYLHPRSGGHGFLWQMYEGQPWIEPQSFEDFGPDTLGIIAVNHLAHATRDRRSLAQWYERLFGARTIWESEDGGPSTGFRTQVVETPTEQLRFEMIEPSHPDSFIEQFIQTRGETMHHITFEVRNFEDALDACKTHQVPTFGERSGVREGARWSEAFVHPRYTGGILVQFFWQARPNVWI